MPERYPMGPLLYCYLEILPEFKACCSGTRAKLTRKDTLKQPANGHIFMGFHKGDHWHEALDEQRKSIWKKMYLPSQIGDLPTQGSAKLLCMLEQRALWFQSSRMGRSKKKKKRLVEESVLSDRIICFPILRLM